MRKLPIIAPISALIATVVISTASKASWKAKYELLSVTNEFPHGKGWQKMAN